MYEQLYSKTGIRAIAGSGLLWAWYDCLFMSSFFPFDRGSGLMPELAYLLIQIACAVFYAAVVMLPRQAAHLLAAKSYILSCGAAGTAGSFLLVASNALSGPASLPLFAVGCLLCAVFMGGMTLAWGAVYCTGGSITATPYVAGAFACAILFDLPLFFMFPAAAAAFFALFPLASCLVFTTIDPEDRTYHAVLDTTPFAAPGRTGSLRANLGIPLTILVGYILVMAGFGYFQHLISFTAVASDGHSYGSLVQIVRGVAAVLFFGIILLDLRHSRLVYRLGLPLMIAGCMAMPFCFGHPSFPLAAGLIICGYTAFDLFIWVVFASIACTQSRSPLLTIAVMRLVASVGFAIGTPCAMAFVGFGTEPGPWASEVTTVAGYCIVIAVVLLLGNEEVFALTNGYFDYRRMVQAAQQSAAPDERDELDVTSWLDERLAAFGLTAREAEVARLLAHGRTQKWIADYLCISQNTAGTHLRHIYQKVGVHTRQEFLDALAQPEDRGDLRPAQNVGVRGTE